MFTALAFAPSALAHGGADPLLLVPLDHVTPGKPFPLIGSDFERRALITVELHAGKRVIPLRHVGAGANGHFRSTLVVPRTTANGYVEIVGSDGHGSKAGVWVLVGARPEGVTAAPGPIHTFTKSHARSPVVTALLFALLAAALVAGGLLVKARLGSRPPATGPH